MAITELALNNGATLRSQAGSVLLAEMVRKSVLNTAISVALTPWRKPRTVHDPGKILLDVALAVALGGAVWSTSACCGPSRMFGPVASDPAVSRVIGRLAASARKPTRRSGAHVPEHGAGLGAGRCEQSGHRRPGDRGH
ncbi:transposase [Streptomyces anulatus]|uniref:transposase n=1 Tax=Streptomyces anulatus TaxID=1892 RepID=UPI00227852E8|nr:transposase [Streptomyces anulatus]